MVTEEEIFEICPPRRPLDNVISQLYPEVRDLELYRNNQLENVREFRDAKDLRSFIQSALQAEPIPTFKPFELLVRIHETEGRPPEEESEESVPSFRVISTPIHQRFGPGFVISTRYYDQPPTGEADKKFDEFLERSYLSAVNVARDTLADQIADQYATFEDMIKINRRLIDLDIRCIRCTDGKRVVCFKYDWPKREIL